jgi:hypothetical protein
MFCGLLQCWGPRAGYNGENDVLERCTRDVRCSRDVRRQTPSSGGDTNEPRSREGQK